MSNLRAEVTEAAEKFVKAVLEAMRVAQLSDLADASLAPSKAIGRTAPVRRVTNGRAGRPAKAAPVAKATAMVTRTPSGRRQRATADEVEQMKQIALAAAKQLPPGFSKGDVMMKSGSKVDLGRAIGMLVDDGQLIKKGERRGTRYWVK